MRLLLDASQTKNGGKDLAERIHNYLVSADAWAWGRYGQFHPYRLAVWEAEQIVAQKLGEFTCKSAAHAGKEKRQDSPRGSTPSGTGIR